MADSSNKKSFWQKYKYVLAFTLVVPAALVIVRALRPNKTLDTNQTSQPKANTQTQTADATPNANTDQTKNADTPTNKSNQDSLASNDKKADSSATTNSAKKDETVANNKNTTPKKLTASNPYVAYYRKQAAKNKPLPANVNFYYPPNNKNVKMRAGRVLTAPSPIKPKQVKKTYKVEVLPEPSAQILSNKVSIFSDIALGKTLVDRKVTQDADGLVKKVYKTAKGKVGEVEMELWILARHWQRQNGRMVNKVYCTNNNGKLDLHNLVDGRLYLEPLLSEKRALFGSLQQMPQKDAIEILTTEKKKFKAYNDNYNQYTWFKIKVKGYIKWNGASVNKQEKVGKK